MAEIPGAHKTDSQKSWAFGDRKLRDVRSKRKLRSPARLRDRPAGFTAFSAFGPCASNPEAAMVALLFATSHGLSECSLHPTTGRASIPTLPPGCQPMPAAFRPPMATAISTAPSTSASARSSSARSRCSSSPPAPPPIRCRWPPTTNPAAFPSAHRESHIIEDECGAPEYFQRRLAPACDRRCAGQDRPAQSRTGRRPFRARNRPLGTADGRLDHPVDRGRHRLRARRHLGDFGDRQAVLAAAAYGRRPLCQRAGRT